MPFPEPDAWTKDTTQATRDESKRERSPASSFFAEANALVLAAEYFTDERLDPKARKGVGGKHRHRFQLALFGQLMAAFEFMLKDFVAKAIDATSFLDAQVQKEDWLKVDVGRVLSHRSARTSPGALLVHPTMGWHSASQANARYQKLFQMEPISAAEQANLEKLWILRHTVAHNAGWVTVDDALRLGMAGLGGKTVMIDSEFIRETFTFLTPMAKRLGQVGRKLMDRWLETLRAAGASYERDKAEYGRLFDLAQVVEGRATDLLPPDEAAYLADFARVNPPAPVGP